MLALVEVMGRPSFFEIICAILLSGTRMAILLCLIICLREILDLRFIIRDSRTSVKGPGQYFCVNSLPTGVHLTYLPTINFDPAISGNVFRFIRPLILKTLPLIAGSKLMVGKY